MSASGNEEIAEALDALATLLEGRGADRFRVAAWRRAAALVRGLAEPAAELVRTGRLEELPGVGPVLARAVRDLIRHGRLPMLDRLRAETEPARVLRSIPGVGAVTADRMVAELGLQSLEELERAAYDGRLEARVGLKGKRLEGVKAALRDRLGRSARREPGPAPPVEEILEVDREYRLRAEQGSLPAFVPRRFNAERREVPILRTSRSGRRYTAMFSTTAQARALGMDRDWVLLFYEHPKGGGQCTVVTERRGPLSGWRVVRGREAECQALYGVAGRAG